MATRVNTRFVIFLSAGMIVLCAIVGGTWFYISSKTGDDLEAKGDSFMAAAKARLAAGDASGASDQFQQAEKMYSRAVNKQQANLVRLEKWRDALTQWVPKTRSEFENKFAKEYSGLIHQLAVVKGKDVQAHYDYLKLLWDRATQIGRFERSAGDVIISETDASLRYFEGEPAGGQFERLKRFRGMAAARILLSGGETREELVKSGLSDLQTALSVDPKDSECAVTLYQLKALLASRERKADRGDAADAMIAEGVKALDTVLAASPRDPGALLFKLVHRGSSIKFEEISGFTGDERERRNKVNLEKLAELKPGLDDVAKAFSEIDASALDLNLLGRFAAMESNIDPASRGSRTESIIRALLDKKPTDAPLRMTLANLLSERGQGDEAIVELQKVVDLPDKPLGIEGLRLYGLRTSAVISQADIAAQMWFRAETPEAQAAAMEKARRYRAQAGKQVPDDTPELMLIDARMKIAQQDWVGAQQLIVKYNSLRGENNGDALLMLGQVLLQLNQPGAARNVLYKLATEIAPGNVVAVRLLAEANAATENYPEAIKLMEEVVEATPDDKSASDRLKQLQVLSGQAKSDDPVSALLLQVAGVVVDADKADSRSQIEKLTEGMKTYNADARIVVALAQRQMEQGDKDGAIATIRTGREAHPDSEVLKNLEVALTAADPVGPLIGMIDQSPLTPAEKAMRRYMVYKTNGRTTEAQQTLAKAGEDFPADSVVLEALFLDAVERKETDTASKIADRAAAANIDGVQGLTFKARVLIIQDRLSEAASTLESATARKVANVETWRLLARLQQRMGRIDDAARSFQEGLKLRPNDRSLVTEYIRMLFSEQRNEDALLAARANYEMAKNSAEFIDLWLRLESVAGDKQRARSEREALLKREPANIANKLALADLYVSLKVWKPARELIDEVRAKQDSLAAASLDARWYADQRQFDKAKAVFDGYIAKLPNPDVQPWLAYAQFLVQRGGLADAMDVLEKARGVQNPKVMEVDRAQGDLLVQAGKFPEAAASYQRVVDAGADDTSGRVRKRLAEVLITAGEGEKAGKVLDGLPKPMWDQDASVLLLAAQAAEAAKDTRKAGEFLDRAVAAFPNDPRVYVRRAQASMNKGDQYRDALADLDAALRVRAGYLEALRLRSAIYYTMGREDDAIRDLREAVRANPGAEDLRNGLIRDLVSRGRVGEAVEVADDAAKARPGDVQMLMRLADLFRGEGNWGRSARFAKQAWDQGQEYEPGIRYLDAILNDERPNLAEAEAVLRKLQDQIATRPGLLMARSKLMAKRNQMTAAKNDIIAAINAVPQDRPDLYFIWFQDVKRIFTRPADQIAFLQEAARVGDQKDWPMFFRCVLLTGDPATATQGIDELNSLIGASSDKRVKGLAYRQRGSTYFTLKQYEDATKAWKEGLADGFADDWEMSNNLAYTLAKFLNRAEEALPLAEAAVKAAPQNADALDTLGWILTLVGKLDQAEPNLRNAIALSTTANSRVAALIHLASLKIKQGDKESARKFVADAESIMTAEKAVGAAYQKDLDEVKKQLDS